MLISADQVITGVAGQTVPGGAVLLGGGRILAVGPRAELAGAAASERHFPGATVLPGLINCHVHLAFEPGTDPADTVTAVSEDGLIRRMAEHAVCLLAHGVTTARDLGDRGGLAVRLREEIAEGHRQGPRLLTATTPLTPPGGHCWYLGGEVEGERGIRDQIRRNAAAGADLIKVMASGGQSTPGGAGMSESQFSAAELKVLVEQAHRLGLPVAAHAHGVASIDAATEAGVDTIEHCTWLAGPRRYEPDPAIAARIAAKGIAVCSGSSGDWRRLASVIGEAPAREMVGRVAWLADLGVRVIAGTDAGLNPFEDFPASVANLVGLGFSPADAIDTATGGAADAIGLGGRTGRLAEGLAADVLVVSGDPLTDIRALADTELVVARGRPHPPPGRM